MNFKITLFACSLFLVSACANSFANSNTLIGTYSRDTIQNEAKFKKLIVQPLNKTKKCDLTIYLNDNNVKNYKIYWDGSCISGHAYGLGRSYIYKEGDLFKESVENYDKEGNLITYFIKDNKNQSLSLTHIENSKNIYIENKLKYYGKKLIYAKTKLPSKNYYDEKINFLNGDILYKRVTPVKTYGFIAYADKLKQVNDTFFYIDKKENKVDSYNVNLTKDGHYQDLSKNKIAKILKLDLKTQQDSRIINITDVFYKERLSYLKEAHKKVLRYRDRRCVTTKDDTILELRQSIGKRYDICNIKRYELMTILNRLSRR